MPRRFKMSALAVLVLSALFYLFFEITKHNPIFSAVNPFGEDPYDAIGSFGIQSAAFLAVLSLVRAFRPYSKTTEFESQKAFLVQAQMMAVLATGITLSGDMIAMLRHPSMWFDSAGGYQLAGLLGAMIFLTVIIGLLVYRNAQKIALSPVPNQRRRAAIVSVVAIVILALYPEKLRQSLTGELFTVIAGILLLFIPMRALGMALVPYGIAASQNTTAAFVWLSRKYQWGLIVLVGILTGLGLAFEELRGQGGWPNLTSHVAFVILVYVCLEAAGVLVGYCLLKKPLGLFFQPGGTLSKNSA